MQGIRECGLRVLQELCGIATVNPRKLEKFKDVHPSRISVLKKPVEVQRKYWNIFD
jgi:hypothetical protein